MRIIETILIIDTKRHTNWELILITCNWQFVLSVFMLECIIYMAALQELHVSIRFKQTFILMVFVLT